VLDQSQESQAVDIDSLVQLTVNYSTVMIQTISPILSQL
jgi:hypothetical protein